MGVAAEEFAKAQRVCRVTRAHDDDVAEVFTYEGEAAKDECAHHDLAEFRIARDQAAQGVSRELDEVSGLGHATENDRWLPGNAVQLAGEVPGIVGDDFFISREAGLHDSQAAR